MAGRKNQFNLSDKQIEAAAKTGREKTQKAYAEKADIIAKGYPTSSKKTGAIGSSNTGKKNQFSGKRTTDARQECASRANRSSDLTRNAKNTA